MKLLLYLLNCICASLTTSVFDADRPRISSSNGNLVVSAGKHKNIQFSTKGQGTVMLNGHDLFLTAELVKNASEVLQNHEMSFHDSIGTIQRLNDYIHGKEGIIQRMTLLESKALEKGNLSHVNDRLSNVRMTVFNRRISMIQRRVRRLVRLLNVDECASNPCRNGAVCKDIYNGVICFCTTGWEGAFCENDINECQRFTHTDLGCQNGATCVNTPGSYECECPNGWHGLHCTRRSTDCNSGSSTELCGHGTCVNENSAQGYKCICEQGWKTDGKDPACTVDVDECSLDKPSCSVNPLVSCINTPGSYMCGSCPAGYTGNGFFCADIDECAIFNGGCSVAPTVKCINTPGSRMCGPCPPGYIGDGFSCSYQGICHINNGGCHYLAQCRDNPRISSTYVECLCPEGFIGLGIGPNGCTRKVGGDPCSSNPCFHGTCVSRDGTTYQCHCEPQFEGENCERRKNPCLPNPCLNGASCIQLFNTSFVCNCSASFMGRLCEQEKQACGGKITDAFGTLEYPPPSSSSTNQKISCAWLIETKPNLVLSIVFDKFNVYKSVDCQTDWLQLHDGKNTAAHSLGRFCGDTLPANGTLTTSHNSIFIWLKSDHPNTKFRITWNSPVPACIDYIAFTSHGVIQSPGSPGNYPLNRECEWHLSTTPGKRIEFHFFKLDIGYDRNCTGDYIEFLDSSASTKRQLAKYCETSQPAPLTSIGPDVEVHFHSDDKGSHSGFQITYTAVEGLPGCGGVFTSDRGEIHSPTVDGRYPSESFCEYKIKTDSRSRIKLTFLKFELEEVSGCEYDYVELHEGADSSAPLIGTYCGKELPNPYTSVGNELFIVFKTDFSLEEGGFTIKYETVCGGTFTEKSGTISSPGYPSNYPEDKTCVYEIIQPVGKIIELVFQEVDLENSARDCTFDYIQVRDGDNENSTLLKTFCEKPSSFLSTYNYFYIKFVSDISITGKGFLANYTAIDVECGGIFKKDTGTISSTSNYLNNLNCTWLIVAPVGKFIKLTWDIFNLDDCPFDHVTVYDISSTFGKSKIGTYCGFRLPPIIVSSENMLEIQFTTDESKTSGQFSLNYVFLNDKDVCGGSFFTSSGIIKSPNFPNNYPSKRMSCDWVIHVGAGQQIELNVTDFALEDNECRYDWLEIHNGGTASSPLVGKYCGTTIPRLLPSLTNQLFLRFKTDEVTEDKGFRIFWSATSTGCGGSLTSPDGVIISPQYPEPYSSYSECYWRISTNVGSFLRITFTDIELEPSGDCSSDYIQVYDGLQNPKLLGTYCTMKDVSSIHSTANHVGIKFVSDGSVEGRGFHLHYSTDCRNVLTGFNGAIESPNFPNNYPHQMNCSWKIEVLKGNKINLTLSRLILLNDYDPELTQCSVNYFEIWNYDDNYEWKLFQKYCIDLNDEVLLNVKSNEVEIRFVTDTSFMGNGFRLEWQQVGCGGILKHSSGGLTSPNYPQFYPHDVMCKWIIEVNYGNSIEMIFKEIDVEYRIDYRSDYIEVINGPESGYPILTTLRGIYSKPVVVTSTGNFMTVIFSSDSSINGHGFIANYSSIPSKCGGKFSAFNGSFHSPNYPNNYQLQESCEYYIEVEDSHTIELSFMDLDIASDDSCNQSYIKVYDGPTQAYPTLKRLCGNQKPNGTIRSSYNHILVEFVANYSYAAKGFIANYTTACGSRITTHGSGLIGKRNHMQYGSNDHCVWTISSINPAHHIYLTFTHIRSGAFYFYDEFTAITVHNGNSDTDPVLLHLNFSANNPQDAYTTVSTGDSLHIVSEGDVEFQASYSVFETGCGGELNDLNGYFASPYFPKSYPVNIECEWNIRTTPGWSISLSFDHFDVADSEGCNLDFLEIREDNATGKILGVLCGDTIPATITSRANLWILFKSSQSNLTGNGFKGHFSLSSANELSGSFGQIMSPFYPSFFKTDITTHWKISVPFGHCISVDLREIYYTLCYDYTFENLLSIYDGFDDNGRVLYNGCKILDKKSFKSTSNVLYVKWNFQSFYDTKFFLEWKDIGKCSAMITDIVQKRVKCGEELDIDMSLLSNYTLSSPGYPHGYGQDLECVWVFYTTVLGNHLSINFNEIDFEKGFDKCFFDKIEIYTKDGQNEWNVQNTFCLPNATRTTFDYGNSIKIIFKSNRFGNGTGFSANVLQGCGGSITETNGLITINDHYLKTYHLDSMSRVICQWNVTVKTGRVVNVTLLDLNLKNEDNDCSNYVILRNGLFPDSPFLGQGRYCGGVFRNINTTGNFLYVKYDASLSAGFKMKFEEVGANCGDEITLTDFDREVTIFTPNYPNIAPPHTECFWLISAPPGRTLRLDFIDRFDLRESDGCHLERVEVRDGSTRFSPELGVFCGQRPSSVFSTNNFLFIKFVTDVDEPSNGFKANITMAECGGFVTGSQGEVGLPIRHGDNSNIFKKSNCTWHLMGLAFHNLNITFTEINLPNSDMGDCSSVDHIEIKEKLPINNEEQNIGVYCGNNVSGSALSSSNEVIVNFVAVGNSEIVPKFRLLFESTRESCGGPLNMDEGVFTSPGYPKFLQSEVYCEWIITVQNGRRVTLEFLDLELSPDAQHEQGIAYSFGQDPRSDVVLLRKYETGEIIKSSENVLILYFWNYKSTNVRGFKVQFSSNEPTDFCQRHEGLHSVITIAACDSDFTDLSGFLTPPKENMTHYTCSWIHATNGEIQETLSLDIQLVGNNEKGDHFCSYYSVLDVIVGESTSLASLCPGPKGFNVLSPFSVTKVRVYKTETYNFNFTIKYETFICGGIISEPVGYISYSNEPKQLNGRINCAWLFKLPIDEAIMVNFTSFNFASTCDDSHLTLYSGNSASSPRIGKFCKEQMPKSFHIRNNELLVQYQQSENNKLVNNFTLSYETVSEGCGGILHSTDRILETPGYPKGYPSNSECFWELNADEGYHIRLEFTYRFHLEESINCTNDYLEIWDYKYDNWKSLGRYCGRNISRYINSTSTKMKLLFRSNKEISAAGFKAKWSFQCGGFFEADTNVRYIVSPGYPKRYPNNLHCVYEIAAAGKVINVFFDDFDLEKSTDCRFDYVSVITRLRTGKIDMRTPLLYCGPSIPLPLRVQNTVIITFGTDPGWGGRGFKFSFYTDDCGGAVTTPTIISSPRIEGQVERKFLDFYSSSSSCLWNITAPSNKHAIVEFKTFEIRHVRGCHFEFLDVYDGPQLTANKKLSRLCGNLTDSPPVFKSTGNSMLLNLKSTFSDSKSGFQAYVYFQYGPEVGCGDNLFINETRVISPSKIAAVMDCHWLIKTTTSSVIKIEFLELNLEGCFHHDSNVNDTSCIRSHIEIHDGASFISELIDTLNSSLHVLPTYFSTSNYVWIRFVGFNFPDSGFRIRLSPVLSPCGISLLEVTNVTGVLTSPNYPESYPNNVRCRWILKNKEMFEKIRIDFIDFDLTDNQKGTFCQEDRIEISDKHFFNKITDSLSTTTVISGKQKFPIYAGIWLPTDSHQYCGKSANGFSYYSGNNEVIVSFYGSSKPHGKGFRLEYTMTGCNRNYTAPQGRIKYQRNKLENCFILISTPENTTVSLYFMRFAIYDHSGCTNNHLLIHDGNSTSSQELARLCEYALPNPIFSSGNQLLLHLVMNQQAPIFFDILYVSSTEARGCGGKIFDYTGKFSSPLYPQAYGRDMTCTWTIEVPYGLQVHMMFSVFDIRGLCDQNYVEVLTYDINGSVLKHKFCKNDVPAELASETRQMEIIYTKSSDETGTGWVAQFIGTSSGVRVNW